MQRKVVVMAGIFSGIMTFVFGFGILYILWRIYGSSEELRGLFYYRAATVGDGLCLPVLVGTSMAFVQYNKSLLTYSNKISVPMAIVASVIAIIIQASWLMDNDIVLNWSIPAKHHFNLAGWYHSLFFIMMFGIVTYLLSESWHVIREKRAEYSWPEKLLYMLFVLSGTLFISMFLYDDYSQQFSMLLLSTGVAIGILILFVVYLKSANNWHSKELLPAIMSGIFGAYSISIYMCIPSQGDVAIALGGALCACFLWRAEKLPLYQIICKDICTILFCACALYIISGMYNKAELLCGSLFLCIFAITNEKLFNGEIRYRSLSLIAINVYIIISVFSNGTTIIEELIEPIFTIIVYFLFDKEIRDYFSIVVNAEKNLNENQINETEFKYRKGKAYLQIILGILAIIILISRWLLDIAKSSGSRIDVGIINVPTHFVIALLIFSGFIFLLGLKQIRKYLISKILTIVFTCFVFIILIKINVINIGVLPSLVWTPLKWIMLLCSICACIGSAILSAHGYYMNIVWLRGLSKEYLAAVIALIQFIGGIILNLSATTLILCQQTWKHLVLILAMTIIAYIVIPFLSAKVIECDYEIFHVVGNSSLGGIAQDGLMITLVIFFAAYIPCVYISIINIIDINAYLCAIALICAAFSPVGFCIHNNVEHIERQKQVLIDHPEEEEIWNILHKCLVRQSKQTIFAMLPYVCIAAFFEIIKRIGESKTITEALKDMKITFIDKSD